MIKIINGVFGFNNGITVTPKTPKDEPFEAPAEIEARLVKEGVAVYVDGPAKDDAVENAEDDADSLEVFTKAQLIEKFNELGLEGNTNKMNKAELIEAIENAPVDEAPAKDNAAENAEDNTENNAEDNEGPDFGNDDGVAE